MSLSADSRKRLSRTGVYAVSAAGHLLVFVALGLSAPEVRRAFVEAPAVPIDVFVPPPLPRETLRRTTPTPAPLPSPVRPRQVLVRPLPVPVAPLPMAPVASPRPAPPAAPASGGGSGGGRDSGSIQPGGSLRDALRRSPVGCANDAAVGLNRREQEGCADRLGKGAADAPFIPAPMARAKRDAYDARAATKARDRAWRESPIPPGVDPAASPGQMTGLGGASELIVRPK